MSPHNRAVKHYDNRPEHKNQKEQAYALGMPLAPCLVLLIHLADAAREKVAGVVMVDFIASVLLADPAELVFADLACHVVAAEVSLDHCFAYGAEDNPNVC